MVEEIKWTPNGGSRFPGMAAQKESPSPTTCSNLQVAFARQSIQERFIKRSMQQGTEVSGLLGRAKEKVATRAQ